MQKRGPGRPALEDRDPDVRAKARALRARGLSWSQIGEALHIGRTSARRLCQNSTNELLDANGTKRGHRGLSPATQFQNSTTTVPEPETADEGVGSAHDSTNRSREADRGLPESLRLFAKLVRKANEEPEKAGESDSG